jgi:hypothetical protein
VSGERIWCGVLLIAAAVLAPSPGHAEDARTAYWLHCAGCHLLDGTSAPPEVPTLIDEPGRILGLPGGREYLVRIPGVAQAGLGDEKLAEVLNFILEEFSPETTPVDFEPFNTEEVGRVRDRVLIDPLRRRAEIVGD